MLAGLFERRDFRDPELAAAQVTVTEVRIGPDLKHAIVFVSRLGRTDIDALLAGAEACGAVICAVRWLTRCG